MADAHAMSSGESAAAVARGIPAVPPPVSNAAVVDPQIHERLLRDYKRLKTRLDVLEKENEGLRASLWEVSWRWGRSGKTKGRRVKEDDEVSPAVQVPLPTTSQAPLMAPSELTPKSAGATLSPTHSGEGSSNTSPNIQPGSQGSALPPMGTFEYMRLNEPILPPASKIAVKDAAALPATPSSLAASLFPSPTPGTRRSPSSPTSVSSRTTSALRDASLKRDLDISLPRTRQRQMEERESWRWGRGYDLKGHRGAIYALKFSDSPLDGRGRLLASAGFDGVRIWTTKGLSGDVEAEEDGDPWDEGDVEELVHLNSHSGPVSDVAFSPSMSHILTGGYDSMLCVHPLRSLCLPSTPLISKPSTSIVATPTQPIWSLESEGLVQAVCWLHPHAAQGSESGNVFAWGSSGKMIAIGDIRMEKPVMTVACDAMIGSLQSFQRSPHLLAGDSSGQIRNFSIRTSSFLPSVESNSANNLSGESNSTPSTMAKKVAPISCLALEPDYRRKGEPRWMASAGFDNMLRIYDRGNDPLKSTPKLVQTLKGKNRNWPIKASWFRGHEYIDLTTSSKRRAAASRARSRASSFSSDHPHGTPNARSLQLDSDEEEDRESNHRRERSGTKTRPLSASLLLAAGSSDSVVLLYDLSNPVSPQTTGSITGASDGGAGGALLQRLEGHKDSVYTVEFMQGVGDEETAASYKGNGLLASGGGDWVVKIWRPLFANVE